MVYAMNQNGWWHWLFTKKKIWKVAICKNWPFWPIPSTNVLPAVAKEFTKYRIILVHCIHVECLSPFSLSLRRLEKLKAWKNRNVPIYLFHASVNIENCIGLRKKFLGLGLIISVRISSAEVFVLHWSNGTHCNNLWLLLVLLKIPTGWWLANWLFTRHRLNSVQLNRNPSSGWKDDLNPRLLDYKSPPPPITTPRRLRPQSGFVKSPSQTLFPKEI